MTWNWQLPEWPKFIYNSDQINPKERQFLIKLGSTFTFIKSLNKEDRNQFIVELLSIEGVESSKIEGEILERESLQSSIKQHFGLKADSRIGKKESGMARLLCDVYETFDQPLTHEMLQKWHSMLFEGWSNLEECGQHRTHPEPMQIVSRRLDAPKVFFEAAPSKQVPDEMEKFIDWFNSNHSSESILGRAAIAHVYFESIHPFEDGNGRIGRILVEKILSQAAGQSLLIAISKFIEKQKKRYYFELGKCNRSLEAQDWVEFFTEVILQAQENSIGFLHFLIEKSAILTRLSGQINQRQEKALVRMFEGGVEGFAGGLSAENYMKITKASRATATRDLVDLVEKEALVRTGELKHARYWLKIDLLRKSL